MSPERSCCVELAEQLLEKEDLPMGALCVLPVLMESPFCKDVPLEDLLAMAKNMGRPIYEERRILALARLFRGGDYEGEQKIKAIVGRA
jgi:hypothetical protein